MYIVVLPFMLFEFLPTFSRKTSAFAVAYGTISKEYFGYVTLTDHLYMTIAVDWIFPYDIDTICTDLSILCFKGLPVKILKFGIFLSLKIAFILVNSADSDEMPPYVAFHLGLHCLSKYPFTGIQNE